MIVFMILVTLFLLSLVIYLFIKEIEFFFVSAVILGVHIFMMSITIPLWHLATYDKLAQRTTLQHSFSMHSSYSNEEIIKWNAWLASAKYWRTTQWSPWWPSEIDSTRPIE